jgi:hypothetical protein
VTVPKVTVSKVTGKTDGVYVYGVVAGDVAPDAFQDIETIEPGSPVLLIAEDALAALASRVPLAEFGDEVIQANVLDPAWLEEKVRGHDRVLAAAIDRGPVLPFRFGTVFRGEEQVRGMLAERRELSARLARLGDSVELGVTAFADETALRDRFAGADDDEASGRAYMQRKQAERRAEEAAAAFAAECAAACHERLAAAADAATSIPLRANTSMILNGAYLVARDRVDAFRSVVAELRAEYEDAGIELGATGPWPPYNFVDE